MSAFSHFMKHIVSRKCISEILLIWGVIGNKNNKRKWNYFLLVIAFDNILRYHWKLIYCVMLILFSAIAEQKRRNRLTQLRHNSITFSRRAGLLLSLELSLYLFFNFQYPDNPKTNKITATLNILGYDTAAIFYFFSILISKKNNITYYTLK